MRFKLFSGMFFANIPCMEKEQKYRMNLLPSEIYIVKFRREKQCVVMMRVNIMDSMIVSFNSEETELFSIHRAITETVQAERTDRVKWKSKK